MTDHHTDELFGGDLPLTMSVVYPVSRLVLDPERFLDDSVEPMAKLGMGTVYTRTSDGLVLRELPSKSERADLIRRFYEPHHSALEQAVRSALLYWGSCLILDCHSFSSTPLPYELDKAPDRPDICIGTDPFHTPRWLISAAVRIFRQHGLRVLVNQPFSGTLVPAAFYRKEPSVRSIMIEVNRALYMDEVSGSILPIFGQLTRLLQGFVNLILLETISDDNHG